MNKFEILAPAGSMESLFAGVRCGANAVYLGGKLLNARRSAGNFDTQELKEACEYCHRRLVKVYFTLNTVVGDSEMNVAISEIEKAINAGVDGFIIQDLGLTLVMRNIFPNVEIHSSTQMSVSSKSGFEVLQKMGFSRGVLPREISLDEIGEIHSSTRMELEAFVHGALCMCVSGQCYMSAMLGSRSGNRGLCAQPCRLPFGVKNPENHVLSLKDMSLVEHMEEMGKAGVFSFKIEGRMKRPEYVAAAVTACHESINGGVTKEIDNALQGVFSRSGFTDGYLTRKIGKNMLGTRQKEDVLSGKAVLGQLSQLYKNENPLIPINFTVNILEGQKISLQATANVGEKNVDVHVSLDAVPEKAINKPLTEESVLVRLAKCGGTQFFANEIIVNLDDGLIVSASQLNAIRREAISRVEKLIDEVTQGTEQAFGSVDKYVELVKIQKCRKSEKPTFRATFDSFSQIPENADKLELVFLPLRESVENFNKAMELSDVGVQLPRGMFGNESEIINKLKELQEIGIWDVLAGNLGGVQIASRMGLTIHGDFGLNVFNSLSFQMLEQLGVESGICSFEMTLLQIGRIKSTAYRGMIGYGRLPLMLTRNCPVKNELSCQECSRKTSITDRMGIEFPVLCNFGTTEILNSRPVYLADRLNEIKNVDFISLMFTVEDKLECEKIIEKYFDGTQASGEYTRGLYYRGVE